MNDDTTTRARNVIAWYLRNSGSFDTLFDEGYTSEQVRLDGEAIVVTLEPICPGEMPIQVRLALTVEPVGVAV